MIRLLIFSIFLFVFSNVWGNEIKIVHPTDGYITVSKKIHLVFFAEPNLNPTLNVNGITYSLLTPKKYKTKDKEQNVYMINLILKVGNNNIVIKDGKINETVNVKFFPTAALYRDNIKRDKFLHQSDYRLFCQGCHNFDSVKECSNCHKNKVSGKFVHGPVAALNCNQCHDRNNFFSVIQPISKKCITCHDDFNKNFYKYKFIHGPVGAGLCTVCHDPHVADNKMFLYDKVNDICENCHSDKKTGIHVLSNFNKQAHPTSDRYIKALKETLSCASCHDPHYGSSNKLYRDGITDFLTLCVKCHKDKL